MTTMETLKAAIADVRSKPWAPLIGATSAAVWCGLFYFWLGMPLGGFFQFIAVVLCGMALAGALGVMVQQSLILYRVEYGKARRLFGAAEFWIALLAFCAAGLLLPWWLIQWVPELKGLALQAISAAVRFTIAALLFATAWLLLCAVMRRVMERGGNDEIDPDRPLSLSD